MILVTGGLGFIGLHTARALLDAGESCVLTQYRVTRDPEFLRDELGTRVHIEQLDVADEAAFVALGDRYGIDGIVHLAAPGLGALGPFADLSTNILGLHNALKSAQAWRVKRLTLASSVAVYAGVREIPLREDLPLPLLGSSPTETYKKAVEILSWHIAERAELDVVAMRISGIYGPLYHSMANLPSRLVHAAVRGVEPDFSRGVPYAADGGDLCYVKDCARAIAGLQLSGNLRHRVYNVGAGFSTTAGELVAAVQKAVPGAKFRLRTGTNPGGPGTPTWLDLTRVRDDTGYEPAFTTEAAISDYVAWLEAGHEQ